MTTATAADAARSFAEPWATLVPGGFADRAIKAAQAVLQRHPDARLATGIVVGGLVAGGAALAYTMVERYRAPARAEIRLLRNRLADALHGFGNAIAAPPEIPTTRHLLAGGDRVLED